MNLITSFLSGTIKSVKALRLGILFLSISFFFTFSGICENQLRQIYSQLGLIENISYSAEMELKDPAGKETHTFKIFFKDGHMRTEGNEGGINFIMIIRQDGIMYSFNEAMHTWIKTEMEKLVDPAMLPQYKKTGTETLNDQICQVYKSEDKETGLITTVWVSDGIILKNTVQNPHGIVQLINYKNIKKTDLSDDLFLPEKNAKIQDLQDFTEQMTTN